VESFNCYERLLLWSSAAIASLRSSKGANSFLSTRSNFKGNIIITITRHTTGQAHLGNKQIEMTVAGIEVCCEGGPFQHAGVCHDIRVPTFYPQGAYLVKVVAVQVGINPEQSSGDGLDDIPEVTRKRHAYISQISGYPSIQGDASSHRSCSEKPPRRPKDFGPSS